MLKKWLKVLPFIFFVFAKSANAALVTTGLDCHLTITNVSYTACSGAYDGNMDNQLADVNPFILSEYGISGSYYSSVDFADSGNPFNNHPTGLASGTLNFDSSLSGDIVIFLKAADSFSIFFFDNVVNMSFLDFTTDGVAVNKRGIAQGLSHAGLIMVPTQDEVPPVGTISEPSGLAALGFGALLIGMRRKAKS